MTSDDKEADRKQLEAIDEELARIERDREAAEHYGDPSDASRIQRLLKRSLTLKQERDALAQKLGLPPRAGHMPV